MQNLKGKRLLVLGGAFQHCKVVEAAHELGVYVIVDDYLPVEKAPAKQIADKYYMHNITDYDDIIQMCKDEKIDGVISTSLDACQRPYQKICQKLGLPCFGDEKQYEILTDKRVFKEYCRKSGVDVIDEYCIEDFENEEISKEKVEYPIFIKPCDSRGSRGQSVCYNYKEAQKGIEFALSESGSGKIVIEKYLGDKDDFSMTIVVINGKAYPYRTVDRILGHKKDGLDKLALGSRTPSKYAELYMDKIHRKVEKFIKDIGLVTAPVFMQGFIDGDRVRFYDPGFRFPGSEFERYFLFATGKNVFYPLIEYALTGKASDDAVLMDKNDIYLQGKFASQILPALRAGTVCKIEGFEEIKKHPNVVCAFNKINVGDTVVETNNVNQRFAEIGIVCESERKLSDLAKWIYDTLKITDENGENMIVSSFDPDILIYK